MNIKIMVCETMAALVAAKADLQAPPISASILYETVTAQGETGTLKIQSASLPQAGSLTFAPSQTAASYQGKFILIVKI